MSPENPQYLKCFNWIEIKGARQEFINLNSLYLELI